MKTTLSLLVRATLIRNRNGASRDHLWAALCLLSLLMAAPHPARAAVIEAWVHRYGDWASYGIGYQAVKVVRDAAGDVIVTGFTEDVTTGPDMLTIKYSALDGSVLWQNRYNSPSNNADYANAVAVDGSGNVVVTGVSDVGGSQLSSYSGGNYYTAKYAAADGALLWEKRYNDPANQEDVAQAVAVDVSGNVVVTGYSGNETNTDFYTAKYASVDGVLLWKKRYNGRANTEDSAQAVAVDGSGNVVVTGSSYNGTNTDYYTAKYAAADGALLWENLYNGPANQDDWAQAIAVDDSGNVVVTGFSGDGAGGEDYYTAKYAAADGALVWEKRYNDPPPIGNSSRDFARALALDRSGNVVVTGGLGWGDGFGASPRFYTAKYAAADGALLWEKRSAPGDGGFGDGAHAVAVDGGGNVVVTGTFGKDLYTAKYGAADGALLWEKLYKGSTNWISNASSLALGPNGSVAITGVTDVGYATLVYWENLPPVSIDWVPAGIRLRFPGVPGRSYTIERSPAVTGPWTTLATPTAPPGGLIEYVDTNAPIASAFYRTSTP